MVKDNGSDFTLLVLYEFTSMVSFGIVFGSESNEDLNPLPKYSNGGKSSVCNGLESIF